MPRDYNDDRPKRSWREIDKNKDSSAHRKPDKATMPAHKKARAESASKTYKSQLDAFFEGDGKAPKHVKEKLSSLQPKSEDSKKRLKALQNIRDANTSSAADKAVRAYLKKWELPPDFEILAQVLTCSDEEYVGGAMEILREMFAERRGPKRTQVLEQRLRRVKTLCDDPDLQEQAEELIKTLRLFS